MKKIKLFSRFDESINEEKTIDNLVSGDIFYFYDMIHGKSFIKYEMVSIKKSKYGETTITYKKDDSNNKLKGYIDISKSASFIETPSGTTNIIGTTKDSIVDLIEELYNKAKRLK